MKKNSYLLGLTILIASSCQFHRKTLQENVQIPTSFEKVEQTSKQDSIRQSEIKVNQRAELKKWNVFYTDSLLVQLIDTALIANYDLKIAYQRLQQSRAELVFTRGIRLPELGLNLGAGVRKFGDYTIDGVGNYDTQFSPNLNQDQQLPNPVPDFYTGVYSTWEIDVWGKLKNKKRAAFSKFLASEEGRNVITANVVSQVSQLYYSLMLFDKELEIIQESIRLQENALAICEAQKMSGKNNELAVEIMQSEILTLRTMLIEIENQIIEIENQINVFLGRYPQNIKRSNWKRELVFTDSLPVGIPSEILMDRPDIRQAFHQLDVSKAELVVAKTAFYPSLQINANMGYQAFRAALTFRPESVAYSIFGNLLTPVLNRRALKANLMESKALKEESYIQLEKTIVTAFTEVFELLQKSSRLDQMERFKREQVSILEKSVETSFALFSSGRASYLEVINAQQSYLKSQVELLEIANLKNQNQVLLYKSIGGGWR